MKKIRLLGIIFLLILSNFSTNAAVVDDSMLNEIQKLENKNTENEKTVKMKKFNSCEDLRSVLGEYVNNYENQYPYYNEIMVDEADIMEDSIETTTESISDKSLSSDDYSKTNVQVDGVDEADIVKTDGKYIYYHSNKTSSDYLYIVSLDSQKIIKKIKLPQSIYNANIYVQNDTLVILGTTYLNSYNKYNGVNNVTLIATYNLGNRTNIHLKKLVFIPGDYRDSRLVNSKLHVITQNSIYDIIRNKQKLKGDNIIPNIIEVIYDQKGESNQKISDFDVAYRSASDCDNVSYILPDKETMDNINLGVNYTLISSIDIEKSTKKTQTQSIISSMDSMYMNGKNLYITSGIYNYNNYPCLWEICPRFTQNSETNTIVHKFSLNNGYTNSTLLPGSPLTNYSMDEYNNHFRILTQIRDFRDIKGNHVNLYILDDDMELTGKLEGLGKGEEFKSSRYMGDKLYLVTFERTDPFFVIDVSSVSDPRILGELKIPGYSTYLHPYDENHIIGLGYNTKENEWGGIQNDGVKLDLYKINYDKTCSDDNLSNEEITNCESGKYKGIIAKQLFSKVYGSSSYSEALNNPRMFIWNAKKNMLFLPINTSDYDTTNRGNKNSFNGTIAINIDSKEGINEKFRLTNIDIEKANDDRIAECKKYTDNYSEQVCKTLISGEVICGNQNVSEIPYFCTSDSTVQDYISYYRYKYNNYLAQRALWIGDNFYSIAPANISAADMNNGEKVMDLELD